MIKAGAKSEDHNVFCLPTYPHLHLPFIEIPIDYYNYFTANATCDKFSILISTIDMTLRSLCDVKCIGRLSK